MRWILLMVLLSVPLAACKKKVSVEAAACEKMLDACVAECQAGQGVEKSGADPECYKTCGGAYAACRLSME